ncbi:MAG: hypothetical protein AB4040_21210 [Synechococcus sp.]
MTMIGNYDLDISSSTREGKITRAAMLVGSERTGTNYLCSLLNNHPEIEARYEIFANVEAISLNIEDIFLISRLAGQNFLDRKDPHLIAYLKLDPIAVIELLQSRLPERKQILTFKVFPKHLSFDSMEAMIARYQPIFTDRRVIDSYISFVKALQKKVWIREDTTSYKPNLKIRHFLNWYKRNKEFYDFCVDKYQQYYPSRSLSVLRYEEFVQGTDIENLSYACKIIGEATATEINPAGIKPQTSFYKQDRNVNVADKVENWPEFKHQLQKQNLLDRAFGYFVQSND